MLCISLNRAPTRGATTTSEHLSTGYAFQSTRPVAGRLLVRHATRQVPAVFRMLPRCSLMWPNRPRSTSCSTVIGGTSVKTVPLLAN